MNVIRSVLGAWALVLVGCAGAGGSTPGPWAGSVSRASDEVEIVVQNLNFSQATVYAFRGGDVRRLGIVAGKSEATFRTPWHMSDIRLRVKLLAGSGFLTERIAVSPGEILELIIPSHY